MPNDAPSAPSQDPVLTQAEAARRLALLADLQTSLAATGLNCVLARTTRLVLYGNTARPYRPSGPTDPRLYLLTPGATQTVTTDGTTYTLPDGQQCSASEPAAAAEHITSRTLATRR